MNAEEIIDLCNRELAAQSNIRSLWQETADKLYPYVQITSTYETGTPRTREIYNQTPLLDAEDMVSGLKQILIPSGQPFFAATIGNRRPSGRAQSYLSMLTEVGHEEIYASNFVTEFDEVLRSLIIFGPASVFSQWTPETGLNYRTQVIGTYQLIENSKKLVDGILIAVSYLPRQAVEEFGKDRVGESIRKALEEPKKSNDKFEFIYYIRPRNIINPALSPDYSGNMAWEQTVVGVKDKIIVAEEGYPEFPYHCARWKRPANEKDGRGIGTEILPQIKVLEQMEKDFIDVGNKWANPPYQVHESVEGDVRVVPGAKNIVREMDTIKALEGGMMGNFPIVKDIVEMKEGLIHRAFFKNAFSPLEDLTGDRRTTLEIRQRIRQTWHRIGPPVSRIWYELLEGCVARSLLLLIRNGAVERPPAELEGMNFGIEFIGPFALELRSQQAKAFQEFAAVVGGLEEVFPGATDYIDIKDAIPRMGRALGVNAEDLASEEEVEVKQQVRQQRQEEIKAMQMAQIAGRGYKDTSKSPEEGSPAKELVEALK